jgi:hypothetical protein
MAMTTGLRLLVCSLSLLVIAGSGSSCRSRKSHVHFNCKLEVLDRSCQDLTNLNVSGHTNLNHLYCHDNQLTNLDIANCPSLSLLDCSRNKLTSLDVSCCAYLMNLYCHNNTLTNLNVSGAIRLISLDCRTNLLTDLSSIVSNAAQGGRGYMFEVYLSGNPLSSFAQTNQIPYLRSKGVTVVWPWPLLNAMRIDRNSVFPCLLIAPPVVSIVAFGLWGEDIDFLSRLSGNMWRSARPLAYYVLWSALAGSIPYLILVLPLLHLARRLNHFAPVILMMLSPFLFQFSAILAGSLGLFLETGAIPLPIPSAVRYTTEDWFELPLTLYAFAGHITYSGIASLLCVLGNHNHGSTHAHLPQTRTAASRPVLRAPGR